MVLHSCRPRGAHHSPLPEGPVHGTSVKTQVRARAAHWWKYCTSFLSCIKFIVRCVLSLKNRSQAEVSQGAYTFQIFLEKEQMGQVPTVQQLLDTSCLSGDLKFEEVSTCTCLLSVFVFLDHVVIIKCSSAPSCDTTVVFLCRCHPV